MGLLPHRLVHLVPRCGPPAGAPSACSRSPPTRRCAPLDAEDLRSIEVFARLAALALERSELLEREAGLRREEGLVNRALQAVAASIDLEAVYTAIVDQAAELSGATQVLLTRYDPGGAELRGVAGSGVSGRLMRARFKLGEGMIGRAAASGRAVRLEDRGQRPLPALGGRDAGRELVHARPDRARRAAVRRPQRDARGPRALRRDRPAAAGLARRRRGRRDLARARVRARAPDRPRADPRLPPRAARPADRARARARSTSPSRTRSAAATSSASGPSRAARWRC